MCASGVAVGGGCLAEAVFVEPTIGGTVSRLYPVFGGAFGQLAAGDVNADGVIDLIIAPGPFSPEDISASTLFLGDGAGGFEPVEINTGNTARSVGLVDLNGDGADDIVAGVFGEGPMGATFGLNILMSNGDGTFGASVSHPLDDLAHRIAIADVDGDGLPDVVMAHETECPDDPSSTCISVSVAHGLGDGVLGEPIETVVGHGVVAGSITRTIALAVDDLNGNGRPDVVVGRQDDQHPFDRALCVLLTDADGSLGAPVEYEMASGPSSVAIGDLNGDGVVDLAVSFVRSGCCTIGGATLRGVGDGTFEPAVGHAPFPSPGAGGPGSSNSVAIADVTGDEIPDLVQSGFSLWNKNFRIVTGAEDGSLDTATAYSFGGNEIVIADFNSDGAPDVASTFFDDSGLDLEWHLGVLLNRCVSPCFGDLDGDGVVGVSDVANLLAVWGDHEGAGDFNGDGRADAFDLASVLSAWGACP